MQFKSENPNESAAEASSAQPALRALHPDLLIPDVSHHSLVCDYASSSSSGSPTISNASNQHHPTQSSLPIASNRVSHDKNDFSCTPANMRASSRIRGANTGNMSFEVVKFHSSTRPLALVKHDTLLTTLEETKENSAEIAINEESKENVQNRKQHQRAELLGTQPDRVEVVALSDILAVQRNIQYDQHGSTNNTLS